MRESRTVVRSGMQAEPNVTPFLDVLLVLLIIFMYLSLNQQKGELKIAIPSDAPKRTAMLFVDFQNIFGQHVTHPRIPLQIE